jgi:tetratricopeptide (TPR) repeat protein
LTTAKAVRLNPTYEPAWGLKANALLELKRYEDAILCIDKELELRPNATAWCRKGLCCYHLGRWKEAIGCFDNALAMCAEEDRQLFDEASRYKRLAEEALRAPTVESGKGQ